MFWLKKLISAFLQPLPLGLFLIALGIILFALRTGRKTRKTCLILGWLMLVFFSLNPVSLMLVNGLQRQYAPLLTPPDHVTKIVVLGGGVNNGKLDDPANLTLGASTLSRLVEGVRLYQAVKSKNHAATLILSGGRVFQSVDDAGQMRNTAMMLGIENSQMILEAGSRDTREEAIYLQKTLGKEPFILVTSAYHMPRAMHIFMSQGMHPIAAPTQYLGARGGFLLIDIPNPMCLVISDLAIHEYLGLLWDRMH